MGLIFFLKGTSIFLFEYKFITFDNLIYRADTCLAIRIYRVETGPHTLLNYWLRNGELNRLGDLLIYAI